MPPSRVPLVANRFEVVLLVILSFVVSTRLIWLQIDQPARELTTEYDSTALSFNRSLAKVCPVPVDQNFPYPLAESDPQIDPHASTSPGLAAVFLSICLFDKLDANSFTSLATQFVTLTALLVAITARVITSSWVGGLLASAVVLSRGSVLQAKTLAGAYSIMQPTVCLYFLLLALFVRSRFAGLLPMIFFVLALATLISPPFVLIASAVSVILWWNASKAKSASNHSRQYLETGGIIAAAAFYPAMVLLVGAVAPSSIKNLTALNPTIKNPLDALMIVNQSLGATWSAFLGTDSHEKASVFILLLAAVWTKHLRDGVPFFLRTLVLTFCLACLTDGALHMIAFPTSAQPLRSTLLMSLEPMIVGLSAALIWMGIRIILTNIYPDYSRSKAHRDTLTDLNLK
jgi:hypothetical protein